MRKKVTRLTLGRIRSKRKGNENWFLMLRIGVEDEDERTFGGRAMSRLVRLNVPLFFIIFYEDFFLKLPSYWQ